MIKSNNFSLKKWFYILIIIILTNIIILGLFSVVSSTISNNFLNNLGDTNFPLIKNTLLVDMMHDGLRGNVTNALLITATGGSQAEKDEVLNENKEMAKKFKEYIENINKLPLNNELRSLVKEVIPTVNQYVETSAVVIQYSFANNKKAAAVEQDKFMQLFKKLEKDLETLSDKLQKESENEILKSEITSNNLKYLSILFTLLFLSVTFIFAYFISLKISKMMNQVIENLIFHSNTILQSANDINNSSQNLSSGTNQQNASLQKTSSAILEINSMIKKTSESSEHSSLLSKKSEIAVKNGEKIVFELISCIEKIKTSNKEIMTQVDHGNKKINEIIKVISDISNKTKVINDIVFQTKLLSFNASVEAARAGEHGMGFSVVAEEVGNLAKMSGDAAKDINNMLSESIDTVEKIIFGTTAEVEKLFKIGDENIAESTQIANQCAIVMKDTVENVIMVNKSVLEISTATKEQEYGISEIVNAVHELERSTQENSKISEDSAKAGVELNLKANEISEIIDSLSFIINGNTDKKIA